MRLEDIDFHSPDTFVPGIPHDAFRQMRRECPIYWQPKTDKWPGFWAVSRYEDVVTISKDPGRFSSYRGGTNIEDYPEEDLSLIRLILLNMDPPQHGKFRRLVSQGFTPFVISFLEPRIRAVTSEILDNIADKGEVDFVKTVAAELPLQVIAELMGVPHEDRHKLFDWSNRLIGFDDPDFDTSPEDAKVAASEIWMYANGLAEGRIENPDGQDLVSILMRSQVDGEKLSVQEFDCFFLLIAVAGNETTRNLLSGGTRALIEHPEQRKRLVSDLSLIPSAVEEMLRWVTPVTCFRRTVTRDTELRGQKMREGDKVVIYYPSANRDENVFHDAERFDVGRSPNDHLAFGVGEHFCLGSNLARLEIRVFFEEFLRRFPDMEIAGPVARLRSNFLNGIKRMPVRFTPTRR